MLCTIIGPLVLDQCKFGLGVDVLAIISNCRGIVTKAFNFNLKWDQLCYNNHLIHNVVKVGLKSLRTNVCNLTHHEAGKAKRPWIC